MLNTPIISGFSSRARLLTSPFLVPSRFSFLSMERPRPVRPNAMERVKPLAPKLMISIHPEWVKKLRDDWNICCSFGFKSDSSKEEFNIIAWARTPQKNYNVSFEDIYEIGAYADNVKLGDEIVPNTELVRVKLGDTVSLSKGWTISLVEPPEDVAPDGFRFRTKSDGDASAVVMKYIHQEMQPVYVAGLGTGPLPSGTYTIKPTGNVCFFFLGQQEKTAFSLNKVSNPKIIQYAGKLPLTVSYNREGNWIVGNDIDLDPGSH